MQMPKMEKKMKTKKINLIDGEIQAGYVLFVRKVKIT